MSYEANKALNTKIVPNVVLLGSVNTDEIMERHI